MCWRERERDESLVANLEGGFAEVDRRCSGAGGAGDDVGHLDRALQSDGTTKCWAFFGGGEAVSFDIYIFSKDRLLHTSCRGHTVRRLFRKGFATLK